MFPYARRFPLPHFIRLVSNYHSPLSLSLSRHDVPEFQPQLRSFAPPAIPFTCRVASLHLFPHYEMMQACMCGA